MYKQIQNPIYKKYIEDVVPALKKAYRIKNFHALPQIEKVVVNMGLKKAKDDKTVLDEALRDLAIITGQKPKVTRARKAISNFAIREDMPIGCKVTLRGRLMYEFLQRLLRVAIPRIRDFDGIKRSFDLNGNLTIGITDETIFPEIDVDNIKTVKGMSITIVTDKKDPEKSKEMLNLLGFPFMK